MVKEFVCDLMYLCLFSLKHDTKIELRWVSLVKFCKTFQKIFKIFAEEPQLKIIYFDVKLN